MSPYSGSNIPIGLTPEFAFLACERKGRKEEQYEDIYVDYEHNNAAHWASDVSNDQIVLSNRLLGEEQVHTAYITSYSEEGS